MLDLFKATLISNLDDKKSFKLLLGISGGLDSMVMLHLLQQCDMSISVAHVDHNTRNGQSKKDALFVEQFCKERNIEFHIAEIESYILPGKNFQSEARDFRYKFFNSIAEQYDLDYILTAHHKNDRWETFIHNLSKAAGLDGLSTLRYKDGNLIRPLLLFTRTELEDYAMRHDIPFVHDISNDSDDYTRNKIRHHLTPPIVSLFPNIINAATQSANYLDGERLLLEEFLDKGGFWLDSEDFITLDLEKINSYQSKLPLLARLIKRYGFGRAIASDMLTASTGSLFNSTHYEALVDRNKILIRQRTEDEQLEKELSIVGVGEYFFNKMRITIQQVTDVKPAHLVLDTSKLSFPLTIRQWKPGDSFKPHGMNGKNKKIKKFLTDLKLSKWQKEKVLVLLSNSKIVQVIGFRSAEGYVSNSGLLLMLHTNI